MMADEYTEEFFETLREGALRSAEVVVPIVMELIRPRSVIDVGCGTGSWLMTFARHGVSDYLGVDRFTPAALLEIAPVRFVEADLTQPLALGRTFDLAISLEVGEHLPDFAARVFVESLTKLAPAVLFSAAIPGQGGTSHLNEQWPDYWSRLFDDYGFDAADVLRPRIWNDERVEVWYAQNTILYVARGRWAAFPGLPGVAEVAAPPLPTVHPRLFVDCGHRLNEAVLAHADAIVQAERLTEALAAERKNVRALGDRVERLEQIATQEHARAEASQQEAQRHRWNVEQMQAELTRARVEKEALRVELVRAHFLSEPRNMSLRGYLRALPQVVRGGLRRAMGRAMAR
jgi:SAM-dependent methyltransferase